MGFGHPPANSHLKAAGAFNEIEQRLRFKVELGEQRMRARGIW
jgi:hypothetical protein